METRLILDSGKTKIILEDPKFVQRVQVRNLDVVSWKNIYQALLPGKGVWSTTTACNIFAVLKRHHIDTAFIARKSADEFIALKCKMIKIEAVGRFVVEENSSYKKRNPHAVVGLRFDEPTIELFLKSKEKLFGGIELPDDDPLITKYSDEGVWVHRADVPVEGQGTFVPASAFGYSGSLKLLLNEIRVRTRTIGIIVRDSWKRLGWRLADFKIEFGHTHSGRLVMADSWDNDSMRIRDKEGRERSKQNVRDRGGVLGADVDYALVAETSNQLW